MSNSPRTCSEVSAQGPNAVESSVGWVPGLQVAVHGKQRFAIKWVEYVRGDFVGATGHHKRIREPPGIHVVSAEYVDEFVRDDAQPLLSRALRRVRWSSASCLARS